MIGQFLAVLSQSTLFYFDNTLGENFENCRNTRPVARPLLSRLRRRCAALRGTQPRCGGASRRPSGALHRTRAQNALRCARRRTLLRFTNTQEHQKGPTFFYVIFCVRHTNGLPHKVRPNSDGARTQDHNCCGDPHTIDHKRSRQPGHAFLPRRLRWPISSWPYCLTSSPLPSPPRSPTQ